MTLSVRYLSARTLDTTPAPSAPPSPGEVELAPAYVGICGTDLHIFHGDMDARVRMPAVLGHEMSGRVLRVGADVDGWQPNDAVTVMPLRWDDTCPACLRGHQHVCQKDVRAAGRGFEAVRADFADPAAVRGDVLTTSGIQGTADRPAPDGRSAAHDDRTRGGSSR